MYYDELKIEIKKLIENKQFEKAIELINEELQMPYIPAEIENFLKNKKSELVNLLNDKTKKQISEMSLDQVIDALNKDDDLLHTFVIKELKKMNLRNILDEVKKFLINKKVSSENKSFMIMALAYQDIDYDFDVYKNNHSFVVNPTKIDLDNFEKRNNEIQEKLNNLIGINNPSLANVCFTLGLSYLLTIFPNELDIEDENSFIACLIKQGNEAYGIEMSFEEISNILIFNFEDANYILNKFKKYKIGTPNEN